MTPHRAIYHSATPRHTVLILAALGSACLVLSGVTGLAMLLGWLAAGAILVAFVALGLLAIICDAIAARDIALELPGAMEGPRHPLSSMTYCWLPWPARHRLTTSTKDVRRPSGATLVGSRLRTSLLLTTSRKTGWLRAMLGS